MSILKLKFYLLIYISFHLSSCKSQRSNSTISNAFANIRIQPTSMKLSCLFSSTFQMAIPNGNISVTCVKNKTELDSAMLNFYSANQVTENQSIVLWQKSNAYLERDSYVVLCSLVCSQGRAYRAHSSSNEAKYLEPSQLNVGCDRYREMQCRETSSVNDILEWLQEIASNSRSRHTNLRFISISRACLATERREPCHFGIVSERNCTMMGCCWIFSNNQPNPCFYPGRRKDFGERQIHRNPETNLGINLPTNRPTQANNVRNQGTQQAALSNIFRPIIQNNQCGCGRYPELSTCIEGIQNNSVPTTVQNLSNRAPTSRIHLGRPSRNRQWPWHAIVYGGVSFCGGTLISNLYVITAGHCVTNEDDTAPLTEVMVYLGITNISSTNEHGRVNMIGNFIIRHENFSISSDSKPQNDIAIIKLRRRVSLSGTYIKPLCLPGNRSPQQTDQCYAVGFGRTSGSGGISSVLQEACLPLISLKQCQKTYGLSITENNLCAGKLQPNTPDTCAGDSGGALACRRSGLMGRCGWFFAGVTSFGQSPCGGGAPTVFTNIQNYEPWINEKIAYMNSVTIGKK